MLSRAKGVEEAEIVPTLAFAAHAGQRPMALDAIMGQATWGTLVYDPEILVNERRLEPRGLVSRYDPQSGERYIGDPYDSPVEDLSEP